ncbi:helix-turn-helix domain-containing protein [Methylobacterium sp. A54F]
MEPQILRTEAGEELVVLPRRSYDVLLARLGDEAAEDRMTLVLAAEARAALEAGRDVLLPAWLSEGLIVHRNPLRAVRVHAALTPEAFAGAMGVSAAELDAIEAGTQPPSPGMLDALSAALDMDPRLLHGLYAQA